MIEQLFQTAQQQAEAGFPQWRRLATPLQLRIVAPSRTEVWLYDPKHPRRLVPTTTTNRAIPLAHTSEETFVALLQGKKNVQQAYLEGELRLYGEAEEVVQFTRLFDLLVSLADK